MKWTDEQKKVIYTRNKNVLVSAAAGSGKTAVLVERILSLICDDGYDVDSLLVLTFTKAAAGEMKERLGSALLERFDTDPANEHLRAQLTLIDNALITTIDGFCAYVIKNYGNSIGLDCGLRVAETAETDLLKQDCLAEFIESRYENMTDSFENFVESFASGKNDNSLEKVILSLMTIANSMPDPEKWFDEVRKDLSKSTPEDILSSKWTSGIFSYASAVFEHTTVMCEKCIDLCRQKNGPVCYIPALESDLVLLNKLSGLPSDYREIRRALTDKKFDTLSGPRGADDAEKEIRKSIRDIRDTYKKSINDLYKNFFSFDPEELASDIFKSSGPLLELVNLTEDFSEYFRKAKISKGLMDFNDLEHYAVKILIDSQGQRTHAARQLESGFRTVMIDEYQDSNYLQEAILTAVTGNQDGIHNYFMVGDVKQSIYSFRLARPDLFVSKSETYGVGGEENSLIVLHRNFRSRRQIIKIVNSLFARIMRKEVGGIDYDEEAALNFGADYFDEADRLNERQDNGSDVVIDITEHIGDSSNNDNYIDNDFDADIKSNPAFNSEILCICSKDKFQDENPAELSSTDLEIRAIGRKILDMVGSFEIFDKKTGILRKAEFGDIVILVRSTKDWAEAASKIFESMNIPVYSEKRTGYFTSSEVRTLLSFLSILDNPRQDIPLAAVLRSVFCGLSSREMADIRIFYRQFNNDNASFDNSYWAAVNAYRSHGDDPQIAKKLSDFLDFFSKTREMAVYTPIDDLIWHIITQAGYMDYISALPRGVQRAANINMLISMASQYEKTSYVGLNNFVRYIENLRKYDIDYGEAASEESGSSVRIMTIHSSKGLQFPIVFLSQMHKRFNTNDLSSALQINTDFGIASELRDYEKRVKKPTLKFSCFKNFVRQNLVGEELRLLYVALTRAEQKLIMTGLINDENAINKYVDSGLTPDKALPVLSIMNASCYFDLVLPALLQNPELPLEMTVKYPSEILSGEINAKISGEDLRTALLSGSIDTVHDTEVRRIIEERFSFVYPYSGIADMPAKVSVSEIKLKHIDEEEYPDSHHAFEEPVPIPAIPQFISEKENELSNTARGTAYHNVMERLNYSAFSYDMDEIKLRSDPEFIKDEITAQLDHMEKSGYITPEEKGCIRIKDIAGFITSALGIRMGIAAQNGRLVREQPFTCDISASQYDPSYPSSEKILIQGIIDAYFYENDKLIVVDYKTDRIENHDLTPLVNKYAVQIRLYSDALKGSSGCEVSEKYLYSFAEGKAVRVTEDI